MTRRTTFAMLIAAVAGCAPTYQPADPPVRVVQGGVATPAKPLPDPDDPMMFPGFNDVALLNQETPEQAKFVQQYNAVGRPKIMVFVNRTLTGELVPVNPVTPALSIDRTQSATGSVRANGSTYYSGPYTSQTTNNSFESTGPARYSDRTDLYLQPGQYDEVSAKSIDYELIENLISDNLSAGGKVTMISPMMARSRLTDAEFRDLQSGRPQMLGELASKLQCDVLVQVTARPSRQTAEGLGVRLVGEALNTQGGAAVGHVAVDVPPPLIKTTLNNYTRFVARKLMSDMTGAWSMAPAPTPRPTTAPTAAPTAPTNNLPEPP